MRVSVLLGLAVGAIALIASSGLANVFKSNQRMSGFSADGRHYIYLEDARDTGAGILTARLQIVDLASSTCVQNGCLVTHNSERQPNKETADSLLRQTWKLRKSLGLTPPTAGTPLSTISQAIAANKTEIWNVRLNNSGSTVKLRLQQNLAQGTAGIGRAAISLEMTQNNRKRSLGSLNNFRDGVEGYSIREVRLSPNGRNLVVLLNKIEPTFEGVLETTLVQGFPL
jgi:predicted secreted protein